MNYQADHHQLQANMKRKSSLSMSGPVAKKQPEVEPTDFDLRFQILELRINSMEYEIKKGKELEKDTQDTINKLNSELKVKKVEITKANKTIERIKESLTCFICHMVY